MFVFSQIGRDKKEETDGPKDLMRKKRKEKDNEEREGVEEWRGGEEEG